MPAPRFQAPQAAARRFRAVLVHGVGLDNVAFGPLLDQLAAAGLDAVAVPRRGYDGRRPTDELGRHVEDLVEVIDDSPATPTVVVGVSGGATLGLALVLGGHRSVVTAVLHEPLLGPMAPAQHAAITGSIGALSSDPAAEAVTAFVGRLVGEPTWGALDDELRCRLLRHEAAIRTEAPGFATFATDPETLAAVSTPVIWTVGRHSPPWRHAAAALAADAGMTVVDLDARHSPHIEDPAGFARVILDAVVRAGACR